MARDEQQPMTLHIGAVSQATGIPVETLRTWERRYGFPTAERSSGNQRLYAPEVLDRLRYVRDLIQAGHRPSQVVCLDIETLKRLMGASQEASSRSPERLLPAPLPVHPVVAGWLELTQELDGPSLEAGLRSEWMRLGAMTFLRERAAPFLDAIGDAWARGAVGIVHEHFASERIRDFLTSLWRPLSDKAAGPTLLCCALPGERHALGLHLVSTVAALAGCRIVFLGADTPVVEIAKGAEHSKAAAVLLSVSRAADQASTRQQLAALRRALPTSIPLIVGGAGAPLDLAGVDAMTSLDSFDTWIRATLPPGNQVPGTAGSRERPTETAARSGPSTQS